jgi:hypothetical protein
LQNPIEYEDDHLYLWRGHIEHILISGCKGECYIRGKYDYDDLCIGWAHLGVDSGSFDDKWHS